MFCKHNIVSMLENTMFSQGIFTPAIAFRKVNPHKQHTVRG